MLTTLSRIALSADQAAKIPSKNPPYQIDSDDIILINLGRIFLVVKRKNVPHLSGVIANSSRRIMLCP